MANSKKSIHRPYDRSGRLLFTHPRTIRDLLTGFVREPWVEDIDFDTLKKLPSDYISGMLSGEYEERASDVVWQVRWKDKDLYLIILLELQSTCEADMALRMAAYTVLFYQRRLKEKPLERREKLPPVLPLVFYTGEERWWAPRDVSELIDEIPEAFSDHRLSMRYHLIDEKRWPSTDLESLIGNVVAGMARAEQATKPQELAQVVSDFAEWLEKPRNSQLRRDLLAWLTKVVLPARAPDRAIEAIHDLHDFQGFLEANSMQTWAEILKEEGREEGLEKGLEKGRQEGVKLGEMAVLERLLRLKFGSIDEAARARIATASSADLVQWSERVLTAESLGDVFGDS